MSDEGEIGTIEFEGNDGSTNRAGVMSKIVARYSDTGSGDAIDGSANEGGSLGFFTSIATGVGGSQTLARKMRIENNGNAGIGTSTPKTHLDVQSYQADGITIGADNDANRTRTNSTSKSGGITGVHYTNAEESIRLLGYSSSSSANTLLIGGGNGDWNSATAINFYVGANTTTNTGDLKFKLDTNSRISLSNNDSGGSGNTIFGKNCADGFDDGEEFNVVIGDQAAESQSHDSTDGNVFIGYQACTGGTGSRSESIAIGYRAWGNGGSSNNIGGAENVFIGSESGGGTWATGASDGNTAVGWNTMKGAMNGAALNTAVGKSSFGGFDYWG